MKNKFIVIEGIQGSGKTSLVEKLVQYLESRGYETFPTFEPGSGILDARPEYFDRMKYSEYTKLLLFMADRNEHVIKEILPALGENKWVICERFTDSTLAYQGYGKGLNLSTIRELSYPIIQPDRTIYLDVDPLVGANRNKRISHSFDYDGSNFLEKVRQGYKELYNYNNGHIVSYGLFIETTHLTFSQVWEKVRDGLPDLLKI